MLIFDTLISIFGKFFSSNEDSSFSESEDSSSEYKKKSKDVEMFDFYYLNKSGNLVKLPECLNKSIEEFNTFLNSNGFVLFY